MPLSKEKTTIFSKDFFCHLQMQISSLMYQSWKHLLTLRLWHQHVPATYRNKVGNEPVIVHEYPALQYCHH